MSHRDAGEKLKETQSHSLAGKGKVKNS